MTTLAAEPALTDYGALLLLIGVAIAGGIRLAVGLASKKRMAPRENAAAEMMKAIADIASAVERLERAAGEGCAFRYGIIPEHVERWARQIATEAENRRLKGRDR